MAAIRIDHQLARLAAEVVPATVSDDLHTRFARLPAMIMTSGLAATGAFLLARHASAKKSQETKANSGNGNTTGASPYLTAAKALLEDAATFAHIPVDVNDPHRTLDAIAREEDSHRLLVAETRARMFAVWLARIAAAHRVNTSQTTNPGNRSNSPEDPATASGADQAGVEAPVGTDSR